VCTKTLCSDVPSTSLLVPYLVSGTGAYSLSRGAHPALHILRCVQCSGGAMVRTRQSVYGSPRKFASTAGTAARPVAYCTTRRSTPARQYTHSGGTPRSGQLAGPARGARGPTGGGGARRSAGCAAARRLPCTSPQLSVRGRGARALCGGLGRGRGLGGSCGRGFAGSSRRGCARRRRGSLHGRSLRLALLALVSLRAQIVLYQTAARQPQGLLLGPLATHEVRKLGRQGPEQGRRAGSSVVEPIEIWDRAQSAQRAHPAAGSPRIMAGAAQHTGLGLPRRICEQSKNLWSRTTPPRQALAPLHCVLCTAAALPGRAPRPRPRPRPRRRARRPGRP